MKSTVLLLIGLSVVIAGCGATRSATTVPSKPHVLAARGEPRLTVDSQAYDFGTVTLPGPPQIGALGPDVTHTFIISNTGTAPLVIKRIVRGCACTTVPVKRVTVRPGRNVKLPVTVNAGAAELGQVVKRVFIFSNDPTNPQMPLTMEGMVRSR